MILVLGDFVGVKGESASALSVLIMSGMSRLRHPSVRFQNIALQNSIHSGSFSTKVKYACKFYSFPSFFHP
jgi:hypothetical protein